jgi:gamma-glutamyltranspeptidase / glutathione hydrolase
MTMDRRVFLQAASAAGLYATVAPPVVAGSSRDWAALAAVDTKPMQPVDANISATGRSAMVSSDHPLANAAALWALERGGNAADAFMTAAIAQCVLEPTMTTLAGGFGFGYFDAKRGEMRQVGGGFAPPGSLPLNLPYDEAKSWTGWSAMVPGYLRGLETAHKTFGRLDWKDLWEPGIAYAEHGFRIDHLLWGYTFHAGKMLARFEGAGRSAWMKNGYMVSVGDLLRQPELAATMKMLQANGADSFYTGPFARKFVDAVNRHGGSLSLDDMAKMPGYSAPAFKPGPASGSGKYRGYDVGHTGAGLNILMTRLLERGDLRSLGHPERNADALYRMVRIIQELWAVSRNANSSEGAIDEVQEHARLISDVTVERVWKDIESGKPKPFLGFDAATCALTIVDAEGNVACGTHSSSSEAYGSGIWVDGVVVNRPVFMRKYKLPAGLSTAQWIFKNGKPVFVMASPSRSFLECLLQATANTFEYGMSLKDSALAKRFGHPHPGMQEVEIEGDIDWDIQQALTARGIGLFPVSPHDFNAGSIQALHFRPDGAIEGVADPRRRGQVKPL